MKSLMLLWRDVAQEEGDRCSVCTARDYETVVSRSEHEGDSFLTITLPTYGKAFEQGLAVGRVDSSSFPAFSAGKGGLPRFLGGFLSRVFDSGGILLENPCVDSIRAIRQLTLMFGKVELPCTDARKRAAFQQFLKTDQQIPDLVRSWNDEDRADLSRIAKRLFGPVLSHVDQDIENYRLVPKHGPGATADKQKGNRKYEIRTWHWRLESIFPSTDYCVPNARYSNAIEDVEFVEPGTERPVKVIDVPKTLKTPRIIAVEPTCMQYVQQGLLESVRGHLDSDTVGSWAIGIDDQDPNRDLARRGSLHRELATLDLSEASDRVANELVKLLFPESSPFGEALQACRSQRAHVDVEGGKEIALHKFASMGSAMTFPIQAMVFLSIIALAEERYSGIPFSRSRFNRDMRGRVRVYGDDIIVPVRLAGSVIELLEAFGLRVNKSKSFWTGGFRESCGKEYYDGEDVSIVRVRRVFPKSRRSAKEVESLVSFRNQCYFAGLWKTARALDSRLEDLLKFYPTVTLDSPILGRHSLLGYETRRLSEDTQAPEVKGYRIHSTIPPSELDGVGALLKFFLKRGEEPSVDPDHLARFGRSLDVSIRLGWGSPF